MVKKIDLQGSTAIMMANKIAKICVPLRNLGISGFQYMRRFPDGSRYILCDCPQLMEYFYQEGFYPLTWYDHDKPISIHRSGIEFWPINSLYNTPEQETLDKNMCKLFNISQSITFLEKNTNFLDISRFLFGSTRIYLFNDRIFHHFIFYFRENAQKLMNQCHDQRIIVPISNKKIAINEENENNFMNSISIKKYYLYGKPDNTYLTVHEKNCLHWCIQGKTYEEIGLILGTSKRTVENHIYKIKEKLNCYKQSQLAAIAVKKIFSKYDN